MLALNQIFGILNKKNNDFIFDIDYRVNKRINPNYEEITGKKIKGNYINEILNQYIKETKGVLQAIPPENEGKNLDFFISQINDNSLSIEPKMVNQDKKNLKKYNFLRFNFDMKNNQYTFDTSILGEINNKNNTEYIINKPKLIFEEKLPYIGYKIKNILDAKFNNDEIIEFGNNGIVFTSNENYLVNKKIMDSKLYLPKIQTKNHEYNGGKITLPEVIIKYKCSNFKKKEYGIKFEKFNNSNDKKLFNDFLFSLKKKYIYE
ncbi:MAG: hypothetical protein ACLFPJ_03250 [Candidatus Woesearchaeota archaeon]